MTATTFNLGEALYPADQALPGFLTHEELAELQAEWGAAKIDEWCAVSRLNGAADAVRRAAGLPAQAPIAWALIRTEDLAQAGDARARRAMAAYQQAAAHYEGVRLVIADIRIRAFAA
jgi:hypothetical protein